MQALKKIAGEMDKCVKLLDEATAVTDKFNGIKQKMKEQKKELEDVDQLKRELLDRKEHLNKLIQNVRDGLSRLEQTHEPRIKARTSSYPLDASFV